MINDYLRSNALFSFSFFATLKRLADFRPMRAACPFGQTEPLRGSRDSFTSYLTMFR